MPMQKLREFLDENQVKYTVISHSPAYTAQQIAASAHVPGKELAKTVVIKADGKMAMAVLPASKQIQFDQLKQALGAQKVELASEEEFKNIFPGCEVGGMPPFGNLFDMDVYLDKSVCEDEEIAFNAGSHTELIRLPYKDFENLVKPKIIEFSGH
jgi:Ala-tRNA(Pro) deacylase